MSEKPTYQDLENSFFQLEQSEKFFKNILSKSQDLICIAGMDGYFKYTNPAWEKIIGYTQSELLSKPFLDFIHPEDHKTNDDEVETLMEGHDTIDFENRYIHKNGSIRRISWRAIPVTEKQIIYCIGRDITRQAQLKKELDEHHSNLEDIVKIRTTELRQEVNQRSKAEEELNKIFNLTPDMICKAHIDGYFKKLNPVWEDVLGHSINELLSTPLIDFIHPDDRNITMKEVENQVSGQPTVKFENRYRCKDGSYKLLEWNATSSDEDGMLYGVARDITQRKEAEEELKSSQKKYYDLFNKNRDGYVINWGTGELIDPNPAFARMLGYSVEEAKKLSFWDLTPQKWVEWEATVHGKNLLERGYTDLYEKEYIHRDGTIFPIEVQAFLLNEPNDLESALIGAFVRDITDRKLAETELLESEARFRSVSETAVDAIISINHLGKIIFWNKAAKGHFGYSPDEAIGKPISLIVPEKFQKDHHARIKKILSGGRSKIIGKTIEVEGLKKDGTLFPIELSLAMWKIKEDLYFTAIIRDISKRKMIEKTLKENEEKFRSLFENSPLAIGHLDKSGIMTTCNENLCKVTGGSQDELIGMDMIKSVKDKKMINAIKTALSGNKSQYVGEYLSVPGGVRTPVHALFAPIISEDGDVTGTIGILEDITEQLKTEQKRLKLESQLRQLQKIEALGALAGGIAHDFNNILFPIVGFAEMLEEDLPEDSYLHENVDVILTGAKRAKDLVKQILTFSRQVEQDIQPLKPHLIIREVAKLVRASIPSTIEIKKFIDPKTWTIMADPTQLHQIAMNLITNASHAMDATGGVLTITLKNIASDDIPADNLELSSGPHVLLSIGDTGTGMASKTLERIFDPYFTTKAKEKGTGLGLPVVHGIVTNYGGDISVKSALMEGSTFDVYIPATGEEEVLKQHNDIETVKGGNERILLVDDEKTVLRIEQKILERAGYKTEQKDTSTDALKTFKANPDDFDLIISDMTMPNLTGDQLTQKLLDIRPMLPIILCTGYSERISLENVKSVGAKALLMKPIIKSKLLATVRTVLDEAKNQIKDF